jgi:hypothetical protein
MRWMLGSSSYIQVNMVLFFLFVLEEKFKPFIQMSKLEFLSLSSYRINAKFKPSVDDAAGL